MLRLLARAICCSLLISLAPQQGIAQHVDIMLYREGSRLRVGGFDFDGTPPVLVDYRVFATSLTHTPGAASGVAFGSDPGWNALTLPNQLPTGGETLPGRTSIGVSGTVLPGALGGRNLSYWNGVGAPVFGAVPAGEVLVHSHFNALSLFDGGTQPTALLSLGATGPTGGLHIHPSYAIYGNSQRESTSSDAPSSGVYLLGVQASLPQLLDPEPVYLLLGHQVSEDALHAAFAYVQGVIVPEPAVGCLPWIVASWAIRQLRRRVP